MTRVTIRIYLFLIGLKICFGQSEDDKNNNGIVSDPRRPQHPTHSFPLSSSFLPLSCMILTSSLKRPLKLYTRNFCSTYSSFFVEEYFPFAAFGKKFDGL